ncbi:MAG: hypothetical protein AAFW68_01950 [Pseudomonadota bacterium]
MINLSAHHWEVSLAPEFGGVLLALRHGGKHVLRPAASEAAVAADPRQAACYPCVPWFGRLYDGLNFAGHRYDLAPTHTLCDPDHPLHGEGWVNPWRVTDQQSEGLRLQFEYGPKPRGFPFAFMALQDFVASPNDFRIILTLVNQGDTPMPAGLGLHPFFIRSAATRIKIDEKLNWRAPLSRVKTSLRPDGALPEETMDHSATGWSGDVEICEANLSIRMHSTTPILHLYAPRKESFFCLEPITHLPGEFGGEVLACGNRMTLATVFSAPRPIS